MARSRVPASKGSNILTLFDVIPASEIGLSQSEKVRTRVKLSRASIVDYGNDRNEIAGLPQGGRIRKAIERAHYDWLFDDLQKFSSRKSSSIRTRQDLNDFLEETIGESPAFQKMGKRKFDANINKISREMLASPRIKINIRSNLATRVTPEEVDDFEERVPPSKRAKFRAAARVRKVWLIKNEQFAVEKRNKRGNTYFQDIQTGRFAPNPIKLLRKEGL